ncbi:MAG: YkvA family protein [Scytonema sp. PMC 1069.18]|nr:YkvA family protein [Scytonema sp. PMC 1069.18]MEC4881817.1 YkvA family protein [Scytonema sp. PMC 1070.18]
MKFSIQSLYTWYRNVLRNPKYRWWVVIGTFVYLISPIDIAPDFIPFLGELDDVMLLTLLVSEVSQIVIEGFKSRQNNNINDTTATNSVEDPTAATASTIDVDAVSVK